MIPDFGLEHAILRGKELPGDDRRQRLRDRWLYLSVDPYRSDEEDRFVRQCESAMRATGLRDDWEIEPRRPLPEV